MIYTCSYTYTLELITVQHLEQDVVVNLQLNLTKRNNIDKPDNISRPMPVKCRRFVAIRNCDHN